MDKTMENLTAMLSALFGFMLCSALAVPASAFAEPVPDGTPAQSDGIEQPAQGELSGQGDLPGQDGQSAQGDQPDFEREYLMLDCISDTSGTSSSTTDGRYILLCNDGSGLFVPSGEVYQISDWNTGDGKFSATTTLGDVIEGDIDENKIVHIEWGGATLGFLAQEDLPSIMNLSPDTWYVSLPYVLDEAGLLTSDQVEALESRAKELSDKYSCGVYLVVVNDMSDYSEWGKLDCIDVFAEEVAQGYNLGYGEDRDMVALVMSMTGRDFSLISYGPFGKEKVFTKDIREKVVESFKPAFKENNWYQGFNDYLDSVEKAFYCYETGIPMARPSAPLHIAVSILISLLIAFAIAYVISSIIRSRNKSVTALRGAGEYAVPDGSQVTYRSDNYLRTTEARVYSPQPESTSSDSSSYDSGSGFGHTSGKF